MRLLMIVLVFAAGCVAGAADPCLPLTPRGTDGGALLPGGLMNVRYGGSDARPLAFDVYPHADDVRRPLALILRGGSGIVGYRSSYIGQLVETFGEGGYVVATPDYRSHSDEAARNDLTAVLRQLVTCHADTLHIDSAKVILVAEDAAASAALSLGARLHELRLGRFAGAPAPPAAMAIVGGRFSRATAPVVPTWIVHGTADAEVPPADARRVCGRATAACKVLDVPGGIHRAENWRPSQWGYKRALLNDLQAIVGAPAAASWPQSARLRKHVIYDTAHRLGLDVYVPDGAGPFGAVVLVHGGGWEAGDRVTYIAPMFGLAAKANLAWISIDYRLTPDVSNREQVIDVARALDFIRAQASSWRIDPARLVLAGESASGQLVALVAGTDLSLAGVVSFYGVYDLQAMAGDPASPRSLARRLFGITTLDAAARSTLIAYSPLNNVKRARWCPCCSSRAPGIA